MANFSFGDSTYHLRAALNAMDGTLNCGRDWDDSVQASYKNFLSKEENLVRSLEYELESAENLIDAALSVDTGRQKSALKSFASRLANI